MENKSAILESLTELDSLVFEEYEMRLDSLPNRHETEYINLKFDYDALKTKLIDTFSINSWNLNDFINKILILFFKNQVKHKQIDTAIRLAEKYVDFHTLVSICELKQDHDLLISYLDKFSQTVIY